MDRCRPQVAEHLLLGRSLAARMVETGIEDAVFDVANHLNHGVELITTQEERERLVELNAMAGKRAKNSTAYAAARNYLARAAGMLPSDAWTRRYADTFELYLALSECEYLIGNFVAADEMFGMMLDKARFDADRAKVYSLRIKLYQVAGKYEDGLVVALDALRYFGLSLPESDHEIRVAIEIQFREIPVNLRGRAIGELIDAPVASTPRCEPLSIFSWTRLLAPISGGRRSFLLSPSRRSTAPCGTAIRSNRASSTRSTR